MKNGAAAVAPCAFSDTRAAAHLSGLAEIRINACQDFSYGIDMPVVVIRKGVRQRNGVWISANR